MAEALRVGVAVLGYDGGEGGGVLQGEAQGDGRAVVEDVDGVFGEVQGGEEEVEGGC